MEMDNAILIGKRMRLYLLKIMDLLETGYYDEIPPQQFITYVCQQNRNNMRAGHLLEQALKGAGPFEELRSE